MGTFDRLSFNGKGGISGAIKLFSGENRSHEAAIGRDFRDKNRIGIYEADPEVMLIGIERKLREYDGEVYWHRLKKEYQKYRHEIEQKMWEYTGSGYDWLGVFLQPFKRVIADPKNQWCSEMLLLAGVYFRAPAPSPLPIPKRFVTDKFELIGPRPGSEMDALGWWDEGIKII